jgi:hypothetical protein
LSQRQGTQSSVESATCGGNEGLLHEKIEVHLPAAFEIRASRATQIVRSLRDKYCQPTSRQSPFRMADKMDGVVMGGGLVDPSKYPVPIET